MRARRVKAVVHAMMGLSLLLIPAGLIACGDDSDPGATRVAVSNTGNEAVTLELRSTPEVDSMSFTGVSAGTTSAFRNVNFENIANLEVVVTDGTFAGGTVTLTANSDNKVVVSESEAPVVIVSAPPAGSTGGGAW